MIEGLKEASMETGFMSRANQSHKCINFEQKIHKIHFFYPPIHICSYTEKLADAKGVVCISHGLKLSSWTILLLQCTDLLEAHGIFLILTGNFFREITKLFGTNMITYDCDCVLE